jgi:DNA repair protein RadC
MTVQKTPGKSESEKRISRMPPPGSEGKAPATRPVRHWHGHRKRLRARFMEAPHTLRDDEILELLLGHVLLRSDTKPVAKELLERCGTLRGVVDARPDEYQDIPGIGERVSGFLLLLREFLSRYAESSLRARKQLCTPQSVAAMARERLGGVAHEELWIAYLDAGNRLLSWEKSSQGTADASFLDAGTIMRRAMILHAAGFIVVHNHPGGDPRPSGADLQMTRRVQLAAQGLGLRFLDHVIVTNDRHFSILTDGFL